MYYNTQYLSWQNGIERDDDDAVIRNATYLNDNDTGALINQFYDWTAVHVDSNGVTIGGTVSLLAVDDEAVLPWRLVLKIAPETHERVKLRISGIPVDGTTTANLESVTYSFHAMFKSSERLHITSSLEIDGYPGSNPVVESFDLADEYIVARANQMELSVKNQKPSSSYTGGDETATISIVINNHAQQPIYMTCPFLYQEYEFIQNPFVNNSKKYIPQVLREIDESSSPKYPMAKLIHALNFSSAETSALAAKFWKLDLEELPVEFDGTEDFYKSRLTDPELADAEYLSWLSQFNGSSLKNNIYAVNPGDATQTESLAVRAATTTSGALLTSFEAGDTIDNVLLIAGDRILIKDQGTGLENGIYVVNSSGEPTRAADMLVGSLNTSGGFTVLVEDGTVNSGTIWRLTNSNPTVGTDALTFAIKQISVKVATTTDGTLTSSFENGDTVDGVTLATNDRILLKNQSPASQNGVYVVASTGAPSRIASLSAGTTLTDYLDIFVIQGLSNKYTMFRSTSNSAVINTNDLSFSEVAKNAYENDVEEFTRWQIANAFWGYKAGTREAFDGVLDRYLTGTKYRTYTLSGFELSIKTLYSETPWAAYGRSPLLEAVLAPVRPAGYTLDVEVVHDLRFTLNSNTLGQLGPTPLLGGSNPDPLG